MSFARTLVGAALSLPFCTAPVFATLIDFDDLDAEMSLGPPWSYEYPSDVAGPDGIIEVARPLTDQYVDLGVSFGTGDLNDIASTQMSESGAALTTREDVVVSGPNAVSSSYAHDGMQFWFVGDERPDYVSMFVSAPSGAMSVGVTDSSGVSQYVSLGYTITDGVFEYTERPMRKKVEFYGESFEYVRLSNFYGHRSTPVYMDNLYFGAAPVAAPASVPLLLIGLAVVVARRRWLRG